VLTRFLWRALPVAVAIALVAAPTAAAASPAAAPPAASTPGWRIVRVLPNATVGGLSAVGPRDAWLAGDACASSQCDRGTVIVRHWDGTAWRAVTPPKAYIDSALDQGAGPVIATSASNAWVFAGRGTQSVEYTDALHWTGKGWAAPVRLNTAIEAAIAPSATQVWAFGAGTAVGQSGYVAHFNGRTWSHGSFPFTGTAVGATSASDVWAGGSFGFASSGPQLGIEHWNGRAWRAAPLPSLGLPTGGGPVSVIAFVVGVAALTPRDAWADIAVFGGIGGNVPGTVVLHWNGRAWKRVAFPYGGNASAPVVSDGHGGIWLAGFEGSGPASRQWFYHYAGGRWSRAAAPKEQGQQPLVLSLSWIPGTRSLWAIGLDSADDGSSILKYGP
jgi:hypothetical protein